MQIILSTQAAKTLAKVGEPTKSKIKTAISKLPAGDVKKLKGQSNAYRLRIGNWRILYDKTSNKIEITAILTRGFAYKK